MKRSMRAISACWESIALPSAISRAACSRRQWCQVPAKKRERAGRASDSSSTAVPTASRNQRSWATSTTAASSSTSVCSSHSSDSMSRWLVGSSSSSTSAPVASARASEARVSSPPEKVSSGRLEVLVAKAEAVRHRGRAIAPQVAAARLEPRLRAGVAAERRLVARRPRHRCPRARAARPRSRAPRRSPTARSRAAPSPRSRGGRWSCSAMRTPLATLSSPRSIDVSPASIRSSVVLPAPLRPAIVRRSRRSSLNETPSQQRLPGDVLVQVGCDQQGHRLLMVGAPRAAAYRLR